MKKQTNLAWGTVVGAAVGATATLLVTPKSGNQIRKDIGNQLNKGKQKTAEIKNELTSKLEELSENVNDSTSTISQSVKEKSENVSNEATKAINKASVSVDELKKIVRDLTNEGKHAREEILEIVEHELNEMAESVKELR
ncbi:YtxH domain-containing protein [Mesobacillus maritimus]|uniref:YtxH domain-containing protein n=1 Tax=Mesobacillus maritimus TaxID=1643336 RepID=A0ABS7K726_9BACI|nr:YtxH domain-containing protein [Mesobacillus maritimus]MBY0098082.1 YtxH domain-containing protein [Mesobacillus maritimus]